MEPRSDTTPLIAIVGETASGKSALALQLAQQFNGEIIAADSRTIYKYMDIGTAKPTPEERALVPHHLLDVAAPDEAFSVADFKGLVLSAIQNIASRGRVPFLVGGTGLYVDAVVYDFSFRGVNHALRREAEKMSVEELQAALVQKGIPLPENSRNPRHLVRALETEGQQPTRGQLRPNTLILGLSIEREALRAKVRRRVDSMVEQGLTDEIRNVATRFGWESPALQAPGYKAFHAYIEGSMTLGEAKDLFVRNDLQLAKRQRTWFKRNKDIHWISKPEEAVELVTTFLNKSSVAK